MKQILLLIVLAAGGVGAAWLAMHGTHPAPAPGDSTDYRAAEPDLLEGPPLLIDGLLDDVPDGAGFVASKEYVAALDLLRDCPSDEVRRRVEGPLDHARALERPGELRGRFVRRRGVISELWAEKLADAPAGTPDVYRGVITDEDGSGGVVFDIPVPPGALEPRRDVVDVEGVFYRTVAYQTKEGGTRIVPYLLARSVTVVDDA